MKQLYTPFTKDYAVTLTKRKLFCPNPLPYSFLALHVNHVPEAFGGKQNFAGECKLNEQGQWDSEDFKSQTHNPRYLDIEYASSSCRCCLELPIAWSWAAQVFAGRASLLVWWHNRGLEILAERVKWWELHSLGMDLESCLGYIVLSAEVAGQ